MSENDTKLFNPEGHNTLELPGDWHEKSATAKLEFLNTWHTNSRRDEVSALQLRAELNSIDLSDVDATTERGRMLKTWAERV